MQVLEAQSLKRVSKTFHTIHGCQKKTFCPKHTWSVMRQRHKTPESFCQKWEHSKIPSPLTEAIPKFGIFICDRNSKICQKNRARTNLLNKTKIRQVYYCSSLYICHTKAMTTLIEYGTRCLYEDTNFYSILIVRSASWLKLKSSHIRKCCEENFYLCVRLVQNRMKIFSTVAKSTKSTVTPLVTNGW